MSITSFFKQLFHNHTFTLSKITLTRNIDEEYFAEIELKCAGCNKLSKSSFFTGSNTEVLINDLSDEQL